MPKLHVVKLDWKFLTKPGIREIVEDAEMRNQFISHLLTEAAQAMGIATGLNTLQALASTQTMLTYLQRECLRIHKEILQNAEDNAPLDDEAGEIAENVIAIAKGGSK